MADDIETRLAALEATVRALADKDEIRHLRHLYHEYVNQARAGDIPALFIEDATVDFGYLGRGRGKQKIERFFEKMPQVLDSVTQFVHNHVVEVDGDHGTGYAYLEAKSVAGGEAFLVCGRYEDEYVRTDDGWRFCRMDFEPYFTVPYNESWAQEDRLKMARRD